MLRSRWKHVARRVSRPRTRLRRFQFPSPPPRLAIGKPVKFVRSNERNLSTARLSTDERMFPPFFDRLARRRDVTAVWSRSVKLVRLTFNAKSLDIEPVSRIDGTRSCETVSLLASSKRRAAVETREERAKNHNEEKSKRTETV